MLSWAKGMLQSGASCTVAFVSFFSPISLVHMYKLVQFAIQIDPLRHINHGPVCLWGVRAWLRAIKP